MSEDDAGVVWTAGNMPGAYIRRFQEAGINVLHILPVVLYAKKAESLGVDAVTVVGSEAGGHPGVEPIGTLVAAAAAIVGDNCGYALGRIYGLPLVERHGKRLGLTKVRLRVGQYLFLRYGGRIVFFGRFVAFLRTFAAVLAGVNRMGWSHFLAMNALGAIAWATLFGGGAFVFGDQVHRIAGPVGIGLLVAAVVGVAIGILFFR